MARTPQLRTERGAAAVEFAIVLPLLALLLFGIVEFSILYNRQQGLHAAAREGARLAALPTSTQTDIRDRVRSSLEGVLTSSEIATASISITPDVTRPCDLQPAGTPVVVTVATTDNLSIPLFSVNAVDLTGRGEFRCE
jgi:Flp pilus assembly protein TadG